MRGNWIWVQSFGHRRPGLENRARTIKEYLEFTVVSDIFMTPRTQLVVVEEILNSVNGENVIESV